MIEPVSKDTIEDVLPLIRKYQEFNKIAILRLSQAFLLRLEL